jgi:hypothetical protein
MEGTCTSEVGACARQDLQTKQNGAISAPLSHLSHAYQMRFRLAFVTEFVERPISAAEPLPK